MATSQRTADSRPVKFPHLLAAIKLEAYRAACDQRYRRAARRVEVTWDNGTVCRSLGYMVDLA